MMNLLSILPNLSLTHYSIIGLFAKIKQSGFLEIITARMKTLMGNNKNGNIRGLLRQETGYSKGNWIFHASLKAFMLFVFFFIYFFFATSGSAITVGDIHVILQCAVRRKSSFNIPL